MARPRRSHAGRLRPGFTLVEVIVVLAVLALAAAVAVPALRTRAEPPPLDAATRRVETLFRFARDSALRGGAPVTVVIDSASGRVWLTARGEAADPDAGASLELPAGVRLDIGAARARFRFGSGGGTVGDSLVLRAGSESRHITLNPWSGDVVIR